MSQIAVGLSTGYLNPCSPEYEAGTPTARRLHSERVCRLTVYDSCISYWVKPGRREIGNFMSPFMQNWSCLSSKRQTKGTISHIGIYKTSMTDTWKFSFYLLVEDCVPSRIRFMWSSNSCVIIFLFLPQKESFHDIKGTPRDREKTMQNIVGFQMWVMKNKWKMGETAGTHFHLLQSGETRQRNTLHWTKYIATFCIRTFKKVTNFKTRYSCLAWRPFTELSHSSFYPYILCPLDPHW